MAIQAHLVLALARPLARPLELLLFLAELLRQPRERPPEALLLAEVSGMDLKKLLKLMQK